ncbi:YegP family protein [Variovorax sp. RHLX14]|uniref:YegP family protein n=1 Tax=Variovorax sp. RHLX14 TaxID=1259731 RepID=UPI003F490444
MFNFKGGNGETVLTSELYASRQGAHGGIASVKANAPLDAHYDRRTNKGGAPYFVLKAANGEIIGTSEAYSSTGARNTAIEWVRANAPSATTRE